MLDRLKIFSADLHSSSMREILYRLTDETIIKLGIKQKLFSPGWMNDAEVLAEFGDQYDTPRALCDYLRCRLQPKFFFSPQDRKQYHECLTVIFEKQKSAVIDIADQVLEHKFFVLGRQIDFGPNIDWHLAEGRKKSWPLKHWTTINIGDGTNYGDVKPIWEINRLQHFFHLGRAYWWTGDEKYSKEFMCQFTSWYDANPPGMGINWQSNLEISLRSVSLIWSMQFFISAMSDETLFDLVRLLIHSGKHLEKNLIHSECCMRNNHLIGDAAGLSMISMHLPELEIAQVWRMKSLKIIYEEFDAQVFADGVNIEQAISYHRFVYYLFLLPIMMDSVNGGSVSDDVWK